MNRSCDVLELDPWGGSLTGMPVGQLALLDCATASVFHDEPASWPDPGTLRVQGSAGEQPPAWSFLRISPTLV